MLDDFSRMSRGPSAPTILVHALAIAIWWFAFPVPFAKAEPVGADPTAADTPGKAESKIPDIENGHLLARKICATCHLIGEPTDTSALSDVPTFSSIANAPGQTADHLKTWLTRPHAPMPNILLSRTEIRDLAGYILSLQRDK